MDVVLERGQTYEFSDIPDHSFFMVKDERAIYVKNGIYAHHVREDRINFEDRVSRSSFEGAELFQVKIKKIVLEINK